MEKRETLGSRLGFILLSAGCAIGVGNVWRFPYITGQYGGGAFVLFYLLFLLILGVPIMTMEYAMGRATQRSILPAYRMLEKPGTKWHRMSYLAMAGNYVLLMYYSVVSGWILYYAVQMGLGTFAGMGMEEIAQVYANMNASPSILLVCMGIVVAITAFVCSMGLKSGVESVTKFMMIALLLIMVALGIRSVLLPGAGEGISFYLKPDFARMKEAGIWNCMYAARASLRSPSAWAAWRSSEVTLTAESAFSGRPLRLRSSTPLSQSPQDSSSSPPALPTASARMPAQA